jgi:hypothetical protein
VERGRVEWERRRVGEGRVEWERGRVGEWERTGNTVKIDPYIGV